MLAIFKKGVADPPQELNCPVPLKSSNCNPRLPREILEDFLSSYPNNNGFSISFESGAVLACGPLEKKSFSVPQRLFCGMEDIYCVFRGSLNNLCSLIRQYGLSKGTDEAMFVIEAYRTLRDRGPYPADQVFKDLDGDYGFVIFDSKAGTVFAAASGANEKVQLFWGVAADGSMVMSDSKQVIKKSCAKSFAQFPPGCMYHSCQGLTSYEHPTSKVKAMPRIDSEGMMCGANFKADVQSKINPIPRVGSECNWAMWGHDV